MLERMWNFMNIKSYLTHAYNFIVFYGTYFSLRSSPSLRNRSVAAVVATSAPTIRISSCKKRPWKELHWKAEWMRAKGMSTKNANTIKRSIRRWATRKKMLNSSTFHAICVERLYLFAIREIWTHTLAEDMWCFTCICYNTLCVF